ncbi:MAG TPA: phosphotransferase [Myxococcales bacterium]|jgi:fructosamine-3-kinase
MTALANPEVEWEQPPWGRAVTLADIQERIGPIEEPPQLLPGGHSNLNLRLCAAKVLRIYRRDPRASGKEAALLRRTWRSLRVPRVFSRGSDYLLMENVPHRPLEDGPEQGARVGRALAEIHSRAYAAAGTLDADLDLDRPTPDFVQTLIERAAGKTRDAFADLRESVSRLLDRVRGALAEAARPAVLLHGDFKPSNLFETGLGLLILDWELACAGPPLMDVGPLLRWSPSEPFVAGFERAYREAGGILPTGWRRTARLLDLASLVDLLGNTAPGTRRAHDVRRLIEQTIAEAS